MKSRHAAALALVGWYLMAPATTCEPKPCHVENYSIGNWGSLGSFDTAEACTAKLDAQRALNCAGNPDPPGFPSWEKSGCDSWSQAQCIATDDPRLKVN